MCIMALNLHHQEQTAAAQQAAAGEWLPVLG